MVPLALFGYLMCNVLLAWATLHQPYISTPRQTLSSPLPTRTKMNGVHLVIFEPQPKIQLTRSSYKVTSFLDFQQFLRGFQSVNPVFERSCQRYQQPQLFSMELYHHSTIFKLHPQSNETIIWKFLNSPACRVNLYRCKSKIKLEQYRLEIQYVIKVFQCYLQEISYSNQPY